MKNFLTRIKCLLKGHVPVTTKAVTQPVKLIDILGRESCKKYVVERVFCSRCEKLLEVIFIAEGEE